MGGRQRKCDFRIERQNEPWLYVEVTQPDVSEAQARVQQLLNLIVDVVNSVRRPFALEVFFRREPSDDEIAPLVERIRDFCSADHRAGEAVQQEVPDGLGILLLNHGPAGQIVVNDHGEKPVPRLCATRGIVGPEEPHRHIAVRVPYADARAEQFLHTEARQLPTDSPGLIMVEMARAPGWLPELGASAPATPSAEHAHARWRNHPVFVRPISDESGRSIAFRDQIYQQSACTDTSAALDRGGMLGHQRRAIHKNSRTIAIELGYV